MPLDQTDTINQAPDKPVESGTDGAQSNVSRLVWEEIGSAAKQAISQVSERAGDAVKSGYLDLGDQNCFSSVYDFRPQGRSAADKQNGVDAGQEESADIFKSFDSSMVTAAAGAKVDEQPAVNTPVDTNSQVADKNAGNGAGDKTGGNAQADKVDLAKPVQIKQDVEPETHTVKRGETLTSIAKEHLGPNATPQEIQAHIKEIAALNGLKNPDLIKPGQELNVPGHNKAGATITLDQDGNKTTEYQDGRYRVDNKNGSGFEMTPDDKGGYTEKHWGKRPEDNYVRVVDDNQNQVTTWKNGDKLEEHSDGSARRENVDGTGYDKRLEIDGKYHEQHWGPSPHDNYKLSPQADGSFKGTDSAGGVHQKWDDGKVKVRYADGREVTTTPEVGGGRTEKHSGPRPEDRFVRTVDAEGMVEVKERTGDKPHEPINDPEVKEAREALDKVAAEKIKDPIEKAKFEADMARFEDRSKQLEEQYKKQGMSPEEATKKANHEIKETYESITRLMEAKDNPNVPLTEADRVRLARQVMSQEATPTSIDQGGHPTCNVTTVEERTYTRNPSEAAKLVEQVATKGEYETKNHQIVKVDAESLKAHDGAKTDPPRDGQRSHASQIFQVTAVNIAYVENEPNKHYEQREPDPTATPPDNGERIIDHTKNPPEESPTHAPNLNDKDIHDVGKAIAGDDSGWYLRHESDKSKGDGVVAVKDEADLERQIADAKKNGNLPLVVKMHAGNEPFLTDSGYGAAGGSGGWHVVTITDYQAGPPAKISVDNSWGSSNDHAGNKQMTVHELYQSMRAPDNAGQIAELKKDVDDARAAGHPDYAKELEVLRLQRDAKQLSPEEYQRKLNEEMTEIGKKWNEQRANGTFKEDAEYHKIQNKTWSLVHNLPPDQKMDLIHKQKDTGFYDAGQYKITVIQEAAENKRDQQKQVDEKKYDDEKKKQYEKSVEELNKIINEFPANQQEDIKKQIKDLSKN